MDKRIMTWSNYEAPSVKTLEILSEGVLCSSGNDTADSDYNSDYNLGEI